MTPGARLQAAIELLAAIHAATGPADRVSAAFFRSRRYMGGKDRRDVVDRSYRILRRRAALDWWLARAAPEGAFAEEAERERARVIAGLALMDHLDFDRIAGSFDGGQYRPATSSAEERSLIRSLSGKTIEDSEQPLSVRYEIPEWLEPELRAVFGEGLERELAALMGHAATDLRANTLKATREEAIAALANEGVTGEPDAALAPRHSRRGPAAAGLPPLLQERPHRGSGRRLSAHRPSDRCAGPASG